MVLSLRFLFKAHYSAKISRNRQALQPSDCVFRRIRDFLLMDSGQNIAVVRFAHVAAGPHPQSANLDNFGSGSEITIHAGIDDCHLLFHF